MWLIFSGCIFLSSTPAVLASWTENSWDAFCISILWFLHSGANLHRKQSGNNTNTKPVLTVRSWWIADIPVVKSHPLWYLIHFSVGWIMTRPVSVQSQYSWSLGELLVVMCMRYKPCKAVGLPGFPVNYVNLWNIPSGMSGYWTTSHSDLSHTSLHPENQFLKNSVNMYSDCSDLID